MHRLSNECESCQIYCRFLLKISLQTKGMISICQAKYRFKVLDLQTSATVSDERNLQASKISSSTLDTTPFVCQPCEVACSPSLHTSRYASSALQQRLRNNILRHTLPLFSIMTSFFNNSSSFTILLELSRTTSLYDSTLFKLFQIVCVSKIFQ